MLKTVLLTLYPIAALALVGVGVGFIWTWRAIPLAVGGLLWLDFWLGTILARGSRS